MIRGNERAIDIGLALLAVTYRGQALTLSDIALICETVRVELRISKRPITAQDLWCFENRILRKMRRRLVDKMMKSHEFDELKVLRGKAAA